MRSNGSRPHQRLAGSSGFACSVIALHPEVLRRLKTFVACAEGLWSQPKWLHPLDQGRLFDFLVEANRHSNTIEVGFLRHWLAYERHWPQDKVDRLLCEIEFGSKLLRYCNESLPRRSDHDALLVSNSTLPANPSLVGREGEAVESKAPSGWTRTLAAGRRLVATAFRAIARPVLGHSRSPSSVCEVPGPGRLA